MKVTGRLWSQVDSAATECGLKFVGKLVSDTPLIVDGYLNAKGSQYASTLNGVAHYGPCVCGFKAFRLAIKAQGTGAWSFSVHKHKVASWNKGYQNINKIENACAKAKVACAHAEPVVTATPHVSIAAEPPAPEAPKLPWLIPALTGPALTGGTITAADYAALSPCRPVGAITASLYVLEDMYIAAQALQVSTLSADVPDGELARYHARLAWARRLVAMRKSFGATLARNFLDYLVLASYSEVSASASGYGSRYTHNGKVDGHTGGSIIPGSFAFDPRTTLPRMARAFRTNKSHHASYGGEKWAHMCDAAGLYFTLGHVPIAFADHVVDLAHNGNMAFDKGYIVSNPKDKAAYLAMLTTKRNGSLLTSPAPIELTREVAALLRDAVTCGMLPVPTCPITERDDVIVPFVKWGDKVFEVYKGAHAPAATGGAEVCHWTIEPDATPGHVPTLSHAIGGDGMATLAPAR